MTNHEYNKLKIFSRNDVQTLNDCYYEQFQEFVELSTKKYIIDMFDKRDR